MNLPDLFTLEHLEAVWSGYLLVRVVGGGLVRLLRPGPGRHRRPHPRRRPDDGA